MYKDRLIVVVKNNGKIMREHGDQIFLPFGSEYSLSFKNLESRNAVAKVQIDGEDALNGHRLILRPGIEFPLERFFNGNLNNGNRFRFIEKTKEISNFRGDRIDDGLICVEFWFEKEIEYYRYSYPELDFDDFKPIRYRRRVFPKIHTYIEGTSREFFDSCSSVDDSVTGAINYSSNIGGEKLCKSSVVVDDGITVKGSESDQSFTYDSIGVLESSSHVMVLKLKGYNERNIKIEKPITVKTRLQCETCGRKWKSNTKYCPNCGTYLL